MRFLAGSPAQYNCSLGVIWTGGGWLTQGQAGVHAHVLRDELLLKSAKYSAMIELERGVLRGVCCVGVQKA